MTETRSAHAADASAPNELPGRRAAATAALVAATVVACLVVGGLFLALYPNKGFVIAVGDDVPTYIWRTRAVAEGGIDALERANHYPFHSNTANPGRPGYPVMANLVEDVTGVTSWRLPFVLPAAGAVAVGLAAAAFAVWGLGEPRWSTPIYTLLVGVSVNVAITANGYFDNLLADATILAALAAALMLLEGGRAGAAVALLVAGTAVVHWQFALALGAFLLLLVALAVPQSRRAGPPWTKTPSGRLAGSAAIGGAIGFGGLLLTPGLGSVGTNTRHQFERILAGQAPFYDLPLVLPVAAGGVAALTAERTRRRVRGLILLLAWTALALVTYLAFVAGANVPAQRMLAFAISVPILVGAAVVWVVKKAARPGGNTGTAATWAIRAAAVVVTVVVLAGAFVIGHHAWFRTVPYEQARTHATIETVVDYIRTTPKGTPVVIVVQQRPTRADFGVVPALRRIRAQFPPDRLADFYVYLGLPEKYLAGEATTKPSMPGFDETSKLYWDIVRPIRDQQPVVLVVHAFFDHFPKLKHRHPEWPVGGGDRFLVVNGPDFVDRPLPPEPKPISGGTLAGGAVLVLLALFAAGMGWATLLPAGWGARVALAPAFGTAALAIVGLAADRIGIRLSGGAGVVIVAVTALAGWVPFAFAAIRARRRDDRMRPQPEPATEGANA
jgi:hypothetical protein